MPMDPNLFSLLSGAGFALAGPFITQGAEWVQGLFQGKKEVKRLEQALQEAIRRIANEYEDETDIDADEFEPQLKAWMKQDVVAKELGQIILVGKGEPKRGVEDLNVQALHGAWLKAVSKGEMIRQRAEDQDFQWLLGRLVEHFRTAVKADKHLNGILAVDELERIASKLDDLVDSAHRQETGQIRLIELQRASTLGQEKLIEQGDEGNALLKDAAKRLEAIERQGDIAAKQRALMVEELRKSHLAATENERALRTNLLNVVIGQCSSLSLKALSPSGADARVGAPTLEAVYIDLATTSRHPERLEGRRREQPEPLLALETLSPVATKEYCAAAVPRVLLKGRPGSGKSTFLRHLALCLAKVQACEDKDREEWISKLPGVSPEFWGYLPIPVTLRTFDAWREGANLKRGDVSCLFDYLENWGQEKAKVEGLGSFVQSALTEGNGLLLLDGLDEVPGEGGRRRDTVTLLCSLAKQFPKAPILSTCRIRGYDPAWGLESEEWGVFELADFDRPRIHRFIEGWYAQAKRMKIEADPEKASRSLQAAMADMSLLELAGNPLLLTIMALVHTQKGQLPHSKVELYESCVEVLLLEWEGARSGEDGDELRDINVLLREAGPRGIEKDRLFKCLQEVTYTVHSRSSPERVADIPAAELRLALEALHPGRNKEGQEGKDAAAWAQEMISFLGRRVGLLSEAGPESGVFVYPHRSFQEYMAARHLCRQRNAGKECAERGREEGDRWWEVLPLAAAHMGRKDKEAEAIELISILCPKGDPTGDEAWRRVWQAGRCLKAMGVERAEPYEYAGEAVGAQAVERVRQRLAKLITSNHLTPKERAEAGKILAAIGDPRPLGPFDEEAWFQAPEPVTFTMGARGDENSGAREKPEREVTLSSFWLAKYPVTEGQYEAYVKASGAEPPQHWNGLRACPEDRRNHPVIYVSWHDAQGYCNWLTQELRTDKAPETLRGCTASLPTEAQWEYMARGPERRIWPWGDSDTDIARLANGEELGLNETSSVGIFPEGVSHLGNHDMAGNVWEWCHDWHGPYDLKHLNDPKGPPSGSHRVLRGGSWDYDSGALRGDYRVWFRPGNRRRDVGFRVALSPL